MSSTTIHSPTSTTTFSRPHHRHWVGHSEGLETACHLVVGPVSTFWAIQVQDLHAAGLQLRLDRVIPCGKRLAVRLQHGARRFWCDRLLQVIYLIHEQDGTFTLGGVFNKELTPEELQRLL